MKKLLVLSLALVAILCSCNDAKKSKQQADQKTQVVKETVLKSKDGAKTITELLTIAENNVDKVVACKGKVTHVCQHSGKRCFIEDEDGNSIKVEVGGDIDVFPKDLLGKNISVKGTLKMIKIEEKKIKEKEKEEEHCDTESSNTKKMREWMKKHNKDYYAFYFIECTEYKELK